MRAPPVIVAVVLIGSGLVASADSALSELDQLKAALHQTKVALLQAQEQQASCQIKLATITLTEDQRQLEIAFRASLKPPPDAIWNWQTLSFEAKK